MNSHPFAPVRHSYPLAVGETGREGDTVFPGSVAVAPSAVDPPSSALAVAGSPLVAAHGNVGVGGPGVG